MPIAPQAFIDVEVKAERLLNSVLLPSVHAQLSGLGEAARKKQWGRASRIVQDLNFGPVLEQTRDTLEYLSLNAAIVGAAQFVEDREGTSTYLVQDREFPSWIRTQVHQTISSLDGSQNDSLRVDLQNLLSIAELEDETTPLGTSDQVSLFKAEVWDVFLQKASFDLASALTDAVNSGVKLRSSISANLMTSRMAALGALSQASKLDIHLYQWNAELDSRVCPFCRGMHGKIFQIAPALNRLMAVVTSQDPATANQLVPWPSRGKDSLNRLAGMSNDKLQQEGFAQPPAHPRCRCILSPAGTVPVSEIVGFKVVGGEPSPIAEELRIGAAFFHSQDFTDE